MNNQETRQSKKRIMIEVHKGIKKKNIFDSKL